MNQRVDQSGMRKGEGRAAARSNRQRVPFPRSPFPLRKAITLIEVLISMGVLTLGILGVAALFPVGSFYAMRGEIYDRADAAAAAAFNDAVTRGMLDPERWVTYEAPESMAASTGFTWGNTFRSPKPPPYQNSPNSRSDGRFTRPFAFDLRSRMSLPLFLDPMRGTPAQKQAALVRQVGSIFFVDPTSVSQGLEATTGGNRYECPAALRSVPASHSPTANITMFPANAMPWWGPWSQSAAITRLTLQGRPDSAFPATPLSPAMADVMTTIGDDLVTELGEVPDRPVQQMRFASDIDGNSSTPNVPMARQAEGHFSYLVSVVPHTLEARDALGYGGRGNTYDVAAVVFNRRQRNRFSPTGAYGGIETTVRSERICRAVTRAGGPNGGEVRIVTNNNFAPDVFASSTDLPWKDLKAGQYVFLFGPSPSSTAERPDLFGRWYRVVALDDRDIATQGTTNLGPTVALRGPDWPWPDSAIAPPDNTNPIGGFAGAPRGAQDDLRMLILDGVVAVHSRTMRLDAGAAWSE